MRRRIQVTDDALENARLRDAFYSCPKDPQGRRLGPLVAYAGTYPVPGVEKKDEPHFVGDVYFNFSRIETQGDLLAWYADRAYERLLACGHGVIPRSLVLCAAPLGGYKFADAISARHGIDAIMAEKRVTRAATSSSKEESNIVFSRHQPEEGDEVVITEDVTNNFKTTGRLCFWIMQCKAKLAAILCILNRSMTVDAVWQERVEANLASGKLVDFGVVSAPVISVIRMPYDEYKQDNPAVAADVAAGNVAWNPKRAEDWARLMAAMEQNS